MRSSLPNLLTWGRIFLIPMLICVFYIPDLVLPPSEKNSTAAFIFTLAAITDWLDGFLARKFNQTTRFGAFLDPVADKLMVTTALVILVWLDRVGIFVAAIIIGRELAISALREWMALIGESRGVTVSFVGKLKTAAQMVSIILLFLYEPIYFVPTYELGTLLVYVAVVLTVWSMFYYIKRASSILAANSK
ncbi:MAG: CDP-diacylglycerol--glycerol-3-phosphate 3-phosphatidyltransferase [Proteobacteria bacterium]|nr:CDP-diacylglycerol--glycerol-3-phosphate 3-phosphatidyltransferase [Pseudomonadota bacterium]MDA1012552.1 CDP-diacylglycerol--glycerol-3-phosphate 3-phosphatidyltransferase [Pseudomonadota bacterium]